MAEEESDSADGSEKPTPETADILKGFLDDPSDVGSLKSWLDEVNDIIETDDKSDLDVPKNITDLSKAFLKSLRSDESDAPAENDGDQKFGVPEKQLRTVRRIKNKPCPPPSSQEPRTPEISAPELKPDDLMEMHKAPPGLDLDDIFDAPHKVHKGK